MKLNYDDYKINMKYPAKKDFIFQNREVNFSFDENGKKTIVTTETTRYDEESYIEAIANFKNERKAKHDKFIKDFQEYHGISHSPLKDIIFSKAWDQCHSEGYEAVIDCGYDIIDFVERIVRLIKTN